MGPDHKNVVDEAPPGVWLVGACVSASVSNLARNRLAYDGAMRVHMAVPCV